jgi:hypothetical protein
MNRLKVANYGKWYIKPDKFNYKVGKLNKNFSRYNKALGIDS